MPGLSEMERELFDALKRIADGCKDYTPTHLERWKRLTRKKIGQIAGDALAKAAARAGGEG